MSVGVKVFGRERSGSRYPLIEAKQTSRLSALTSGNVPRADSCTATSKTVRSLRRVWPRDAFKVPIVPFSSTMVIEQRGLTQGKQAGWERTARDAKPFSSGWLKRLRRRGD